MGNDDDDDNVGDDCSDDDFGHCDENGRGGRRRRW